MPAEDIFVIAALAVFCLGIVILKWVVRRHRDVRRRATWGRLAPTTRVAVAIALTVLLIALLYTFGLRLPARH